MPWGKLVGLVVALAIAGASAVGCGGDDGGGTPTAGPTGATGPTGPNGGNVPPWKRDRLPPWKRDRVPPWKRGATGATGPCEPGYDPCVPSYPPDVDCPQVGGPVDVTGPDPHGLDADDDGVGCEV
jgi:hypothetical protein